MSVELPKDAEGRKIPLDTVELFDLNGKRVIIQGGIVVSEED